MGMIPHERWISQKPCGRIYIAYTPQSAIQALAFMKTCTNPLIVWYQQGGLPEDELAKLTCCKTIENLSIDGCSINQVIQNLHTFTNLKALTFWTPDFSLHTPEVKILKFLPKTIEKLDISFTNIGDFWAITQFTNLKELNAEQCEYFKICKDLLPNTLKVLKLGGTKIEGKALGDKEITLLPEAIENLYIDSSKISSLTPLIHLTKLKTLDLTNCENLASDEGIDLLSKDLEEINLTGTPINTPKTRCKLRTLYPGITITDLFSE
jgi:hypothetical protein